jgi:hypothetical protein
MPDQPSTAAETHLQDVLRGCCKTFSGVLREAARWLNALGVTHVAMEATGIYSMPVCHALIEHGEFEQVLVCNAGYVKNVAGRVSSGGRPWRPSGVSIGGVHRGCGEGSDAA